jgi:hypothetical protein
MSNDENRLSPDEIARIVARDKPGAKIIESSLQDGIAGEQVHVDFGTGPINDLKDRVGVQGDAVAGQALEDTAPNELQGVQTVRNGVKTNNFVSREGMKILGG